jgi:hypothetical protein
LNGGGVERLKRAHDRTTRGAISATPRTAPAEIVGFKFRRG